MIARAVDGSYQEGGRFFADLDPMLTPQVPPQHISQFSMSSLVLINTFAMAFLSHYNGNKYYRELKHHSPAKSLRCTATAMGISTCVFIMTMLAGFYTFGTHSDGVILKNYSRDDAPINIARIGMGLSIVASFPLMFSGLREAVITLLKIIFPSNSSQFDNIWVQDLLSIAILWLLFIVAMVLTDAGIVVGVVGAVCGSTIIYIVPCLLYASSIKGYLTITCTQMFELLWLRFLTLLGIFLAIAGCISSLAF